MPDRVAAQPGPAAPDDVDLQSVAHPLAAFEQGSPGHGAYELAARSRCRDQLGFAASWAKFGVKIARSTSLAIPGSFAREEAN